MNVMPTMSKDAAAMEQPRARMGLIIPSVNTYSEPQFNHYAPDGLGIHVARARVAGQWKRPLPEMKDEIAGAAKLLSDAHPDVIVFHCTDTSMTQGPQGEGKILDIVKDATGIDAMAPSRRVLRRGCAEEPACARLADRARHEEGRAADPIQEQQGGDRLSPRRGHL